MMHQITGFFFITHPKTKKRYVIYSTLYKHGRYANTFEIPIGMSDEQARINWVLEHSEMVDLTLTQKRAHEKQNKIILS